MYRLVVSYRHPADPQAFLEHYRSVHAPLAGRLPDLVSYTYGVCESPDGTMPEHFLVAVLEWATKEAALAALASPQGRETTADLANFAHAGASRAFSEVDSVV